MRPIMYESRTTLFRITFRPGLVKYLTTTPPPPHPLTPFDLFARLSLQYCIPRKYLPPDMEEKKKRKKNLLNTVVDTRLPAPLTVVDTIYTVPPGDTKRFRIKYVLEVCPQKRVNFRKS